MKRVQEVVMALGVVRALGIVRTLRLVWSRACKRLEALRPRLQFEPWGIDGSVQVKVAKGLD